MQPDVLSHLLNLIPVSGRLEVRCHLGSPWRIEPGPAGQQEMPFHVVVQGAAILEVPGRAPTRVNAGDVILLPHGGAHALHDGSGQPPRKPVERPSAVLTVADSSDGVPVADILCGRFFLDAFSERLVRRFLPDSLVVRSEPDAASELPPGQGETSALRQLMALMRREAEGEGPGSAALIGHLCAALFTLALRHASASELEQRSLLALARSPHLQPAMLAMFEAPERPWTLQSLAALCHMSRATLIRQFEAVTGHSPVELLLQIRMALAMRRLTQTEQSMAMIADDAGYQSEAAFQRAFKRHIGMTPARFRAAGRSSSVA